MKDIEAKELKERLENKEQLTILDVREEYEYEEFNIGAQNIPLHELPQQIDSLQHLQSEEVIVHCNSGNKSEMARMVLKQAGFTNVRNLKGGIVAYKAL